MKTTHRIPVVAVLALAAAAVGAQTTHEQIKREFDQARRNGDLIVAPETGLTERELYPQRYPTRVVVRKSRDEVRAEYAAAQRNGELIANGELGLTQAQLNPTRYGAATAVAGRSRADVIAELREARRNGDLFIGGESGLTLREAYPQRYVNAPAGRKASETVAQPSLPAPNTTTR
jgi:lambda repressor-like predicted transcriptional regulator